MNLYKKRDNDTYLRVIALNKAYEAQLITRQMYSSEMKKVQQIQERAILVEKEKQDLIDRTKHKLLNQFASL